MQPGQILVNANGEERKILFVSGDLIIPSKVGNFDMASSSFTKKELEKFGWSLLEEPWVPGDEESFFTVLSDGDIKEIKWQICTKNYYRLRTNNIHRTHKNAELYRQKLIETMGGKKNNK